MSDEEVGSRTHTRLQMADRSADVQPHREHSGAHTHPMEAEMHNEPRLFQYFLIFRETKGDGDRTSISCLQGRRPKPEHTP